jgi:hypothetical protein
MEEEERLESLIKDEDWRERILSLDSQSMSGK